MNRILSLSILVLIATMNAYSSDIAKWDFENISQTGSSFKDEISGLKASVCSKQSTKLPLVSQDLSCALFLDNSEDDSDAENAMLVVSDSGVLTGHHSDGYGYGSLTIEIEFMPTAIKQCQLVRKTNGTTNDGYQLWMDKNGKIGFAISNGKGQYCRVISKRKVELGKWHKIIATWDGRYQSYNMQLHLDGYIAWGGSAPTTVLMDTESPLTIGGLYREENNYGQFFAGYIKSVYISYNRPEIMTISGKADAVEVVETGKHLSGQKGLIKSRFVYETPPTPECHAPTIESLGGGRLAAAWFGGTQEGHTDVAIWFSQYDGKEWSKPVAVVRAPQHNKVCHISLFNPVLFKHSNGTLMLFYKDGWLEAMESRLMTSKDDGKTWSEIKYYEPPLHGPSKNKAIELADGAILCPAGGDKMEITYDMGDNWDTVKIGNPNGYSDVIQPTILNHGGGRLRSLFRTREGVIAQSVSANNGRSWTDIELTVMPNNNSGFDAVTLQDGRHLMIYNHVGMPEGKWGGPRTPLNIAISDDGISWKAALVLEDERGEYSYPAVIQDENGLVHVIYTWHRTRIKWAVIDVEKLELREIENAQWPEPAVVY